MNAKFPNGNGAVGMKPGNAGDFAYQSDSVDIVGNGEYTFKFGPLGSDFNYPLAPSTLSFNWPSDSGFAVGPSGTSAPTVVTINGQRFLQVIMFVKGFTGPYPGFTGWIY